MKYIQRSVLSIGYATTALAYEYHHYGKFNFKYVAALNAFGLMLSLHSNFNSALKKSIFISCALSALSIPFFLAIGAGISYFKKDCAETYSLPAYKFVESFMTNLAPLVTGAALGVFLKHDANYEALLDLLLKANDAVKERLDLLRSQIS